ncbi:glycosyltransferase family 2 protein [Metabacillus arenae]|uniref:Glycosyltransferase family 2 protein n=1 Tax=Metabacillus arenae TaxID=2771434 RepID=A0A926NKY9_9BACI|nr:glycosyltransferase family 2 protein [Metabacillus arenae]MBD1379731.1 glycosyltransferase family 2 protein [Metabacillus arenae]
MKVSIVITTYNRKEELAELIETISLQTYLPFEIIIVNDGGERVESLASYYHDLPINIIHLDENVKHVNARNIGVRQATGDFIMLSDDDDFFTPGHIERMVKAIADADLVYSDVEIVTFREKGKQRIPKTRRLFAYHYDLAAMRRFSTYVPSGSLYRRSLHEKIGYFDPDVHNYWDWDFFLRAAEESRVKRVPVASVIYAFAEDGQNQSAQLSGKRENYLKVLCDKHQLGELPQENFFTLLELPELKQREAESEIVWDGLPVSSRLMNP